MMTLEERKELMVDGLAISRVLRESGESALVAASRTILLLVDQYNNSVPKVDYFTLKQRVNDFLGTLTETEAGPEGWPEYEDLLEELG